MTAYMTIGLIYESTQYIEKVENTPNPALSSSFSSLKQLLYNCEF